MMMPPFKSLGAFARAVYDATRHDLVAIHGDEQSPGLAVDRHRGIGGASLPAIDYRDGGLIFRPGGYLAVACTPLVLASQFDTARAA